MKSQELKEWIQTTFESFVELGYVIIHDNETDIYKELFEEYLINNNIDYDVEFEFDYVRFIKLTK
jgi:hypothetical protein